MSARGCPSVILYLNLRALPLVLWGPHVNLPNLRYRYRSSGTIFAPILANKFLPARWPKKFRDLSQEWFNNYESGVPFRF
jgi:hypothetical protein